MKNQNKLFALLAVFGIWPGAGTAQAQTLLTVGVWGDNSFGETSVPVAARSGVTAISAGDDHIVVLKSDGSVVAWGNNRFGQVTGTPTTNFPYSATADPVTLQGQVLSGITTIAAGTAFTVALKKDGSVVAWGFNGDGELTVPVAAQSGVTAIAAGYDQILALKNNGSVVAWGAGQTTVPVTAQSGVTAIAAGPSHSLALKSDGSVVAWGDNRNGQTTVPVAAHGGVTAIAVGGLHSVALKNDGSVVVWGDDYAGLNTVPAAAQSGVVAIAAGENHIVALKNDGSVVAWGYEYDQTPMPAGLTGVKAIAAGGENTVVLVTPMPPTITTPPMSQNVNRWQNVSFSVAAAGYPLYYQWRQDGVDLTGATSDTYRLDVVQTNQSGHSYSVVVSNLAGGVTSAPPAVLAVNPVDATGVVAAWGANGGGQTTVPIAAQRRVTAIAAGAYHGVALKNDGAVVTWGENWAGQATVPVTARSGVAAIAAGQFHTVALKTDGTVVAWGNNPDGEVTGTSPTNNPSFATASPVILDGQVLNGVTAIAAGGECPFDCVGFTVALKADGTVVAWGDNQHGEVTGTPATNDPFSATANPVTLGGQLLSGVIAITAGGAHIVALKSNGSVVAWGDNAHAQVTGTPTTNAPYSAVANLVTLEGQVLTGVIAIAAGVQHTVALKRDGTVVAWGQNDLGQVTGTPTTGYPDSAVANPVTLDGQVLSEVIAIAAGELHTVALKKDGTVVAWGSNGFGQVTGAPVTNGPYQSAVAQPLAPGGQVLSGVTAIAAGAFHTVALLGTAPLLPSLQVQGNGNELILSWPTNAVGFTLQSTAALAPALTWVDYSNSPVVLGAQFTVTNTVSGAARYFRLLKR